MKKTKTFIAGMSLIIAVLVISSAVVGTTNSNVRTNNVANPSQLSLIIAEPAAVELGHHHGNSSEQVYYINQTYLAGTSQSEAQIGDSIMLNMTYGTEQVMVNGRTITLSIALNFNESNNVSNHTATNSIDHQLPDPVFEEQTFYQNTPYPNGAMDFAGLDVAVISALSLSGFTDTQLIAFFGEVASGLSGGVYSWMAGLSLGSALLFSAGIATIIAAVAAEYIYLSIQAYQEGYPSIYMMVGGDWGNWHVGAYSELGISTVSATQPISEDSGWYLPSGTSWMAGTHILSLMGHTGVWNPNAEPPWPGV
jgi:hypothetical protein